MKKQYKDLCSNIKLLVSDVDGVLTDGKILISSDGTESKKFNVEDGTGVAIAKFAKLPIVFLSGRYSKATEIRAEELNIQDCIQGFLDKKNKIEEIKNKYNISFHQIAYIGDGIIDIPVLEIVGFPISVPNAHPDVIDKAKYITKKNGGDGVLQEVVELILKNQNKYQKSLEIMKKRVYK
tara:strand:+ start:231 stop:770 length:540 start_codon:yes stop_codon:yes gene_type:complete